MKKIKIITFMVFVFSLLLLSACVVNKPQPVVSSIEIVSNPTKTTYLFGEELDLSGGKIKVNFSDETSEDVSMTDRNVSVDYDNSIAVETDVTVSYKDKTATFKVVFQNIAVEKIEISNQITKTQYYVGEIINLSGGTLKVTYNNKNTNEFLLTDSRISISDFDNTTAGDKTVTITFNDKTTTFTVKYISLEISSISVKTPITKTTYTIGEDLDITGGEISVKYTNNSTETISLKDDRVTISSFDKTSIGNKMITINYTGKTTTFTVTYTKKAISSISLKSSITKATYFVGDSINLAGGKITVKYVDNSQEDIDISAEGVTVTNFNSSTIGNKTITVTYGSKSCIFTVTVIYEEKIVIKKLPTKVFYNTNDTLDLTNGTVTINKRDGTSETISMSNENLTISGFSSTNAGTKTVKIEYLNASVTFNVAVFEPLSYNGSGNFKFNSNYVSNNLDYSLFDYDNYKKITYTTTDTSSFIGIKINGIFSSMYCVVFKVVGTKNDNIEIYVGTANGDLAFTTYVSKEITFTGYLQTIVIPLSQFNATQKNQINTIRFDGKGTKTLNEFKVVDAYFSTTSVSEVLTGVNYDTVSNTFDVNTGWKNDSYYTASTSTYGYNISYNKNLEAWCATWNNISNITSNLNYLVIKYTSYSPIMLKVQHYLDGNNSGHEVTLETGIQETKIIPLSEITTKVSLSDIGKIVFIAQPGISGASGTFSVHELYFSVDGALESPNIYDSISDEFDINSNYQESIDRTYEVVKASGVTTVSVTKNIDKKNAFLITTFNGNNSLDNFDRIHFIIQGDSSKQLKITIGNISNTYTLNGFNQKIEIDLSNLTARELNEIEFVKFEFEPDKATNSEFKIIESYFTTIPFESDYEYNPIEVPNYVLAEEQASFKFFWDFANTTEESAGYGLIQDRATVHSSGGYTNNLASTASVGFGLSAYMAGVENKWITYQQGYNRTLGTLKTIKNMQELHNLHGFLYHFVNKTTGARAGTSELSVIDTAILVNGVLTSGEYFGKEIKELATEIYLDIEWNWYLNRTRNMFYMEYKPEEGFEGAWDMYGEQLMLHILAAGSPDYSVGKSAYDTMKRASGYGGYKSDNFYMTWHGPIFVYQFSHAWMDFSKYNDADGVNWHDNSVAASIAAYNYAKDMNQYYKSFNELSWGSTASDGPNGYGAFGNLPIKSNNLDTKNAINGTMAPCGAIGSIVFTPDLVKPAMQNYSQIAGLQSHYGFRDSYNLGVQNGFIPFDNHKMPNNGSNPWYATDVIGIDKGITVLMIENYRSGLIWNYYMQNKYVINGLKNLGFIEV